MIAAESFATIGSAGHSGCIVDGIDRPCSEVSFMLGNGIAKECPNNNCGPAVFAVIDNRAGEKPIDHILVPLDRNRETGELGYFPGQWGYDREWLEKKYGNPHPAHSPQNPAPTQQGRLSEEDCNKRLASIFGSPSAVVSTVNEPPGVRGGAQNRIHHLANNGVLHIYGNAQGTTTDAPLYRPPGGTFQRRGSGEYAERVDGKITGYSNVFQFSYSGGLVIKFFHVGGTSGGEAGGARLGRYPGQTNAVGSLRIGNIGGLGGTGDRYNHSHIEFRVNGRRTDPRKIYCGY